MFLDGTESNCDPVGFAGSPGESALKLVAQQGGIAEEEKGKMKGKGKERKEEKENTPFAKAN